MPITLQPVTRDNWRDCAAVSVPAEQQRFVNPVTYYLCLCHYGDVWHPLAVVRDGAVAARRVLRIRYADKSGAATVREVEPLAYLGGRDHWYLLAWCRLRDGVRAFRTDRIGVVTVTAEVARRGLAPGDIDIPGELVHPLTLG